MTSNIGSSNILEGIKNNNITEEAREKVMEIMKRSFKPEFLNRVDNIIMFKPLSVESIKNIIEIFLEGVRGKLKEKNITIELTDKAKELIAREGYDPFYGARPLKRYIENSIETKLAYEIIKGTVKNGSQVIVDEKEGELIFN